MTREHKLALIVGFALVLAVAILISDHFSGASRAEGGGVIADNGSSRLLGPGGRDIAFDLPGAQEVAERPADSTPAVTDTTGGERLASNDSGRSVLESLADSVNTAIHDLANGHTPPSAIQTEPRNEIRMGAPVNPPADEVARDVRGDIEPLDLTRHNVQPNETLWGIAAKYYGDGNLYKKLAEFNKGRVGDGGVVHPGVTILVPTKGALLGEAASGAPAGATPATPVKPATKPKSGGGWSYTVKKGDTLGLISQRELGTVKRMQDILDLNKDQIDNADEITVGMVLKMPARG
ncbi:MAG: LysM peptidoglycan-binding domain-containing protein [Phycisphaeraceae bacterium]|nr:LysM peptidoglycan-binding domain-containing protein [Phycisphaerales bacterium]MCB9842898.1 LysM peptidoglycan-binding domain-containing protein [Phycisphaeraceae bacterium]